MATCVFTRSGRAGMVLGVSALVLGACGGSDGGTAGDDDGGFDGIISFSDAGGGREGGPSTDGRRADGSGGSPADGPTGSGGATDAPLSETDGNLGGGGTGGVPSTNDGAVDDGGGGSGGSAGTGGTGDDGGPGMDAFVCRGPGEACLADQACCSGSCDLQNMTCRSSITQCAPEEAGCLVSTDCCNLSCVAGRCGTAACIADTQPCGASAASCCSGNCQNGTCQALNTSCKTAGNPCGSSDECCSGLCQGNKCAIAASYCIQPGDICHRNTDCCTGYCSIAQGASAGVCMGLDTTAGGGCTPDGVICSDCGECCSRLCAPYVTGVKICQPPSGCRVTNNLCQSNKDCCGGDPTEISEGAGSVQCVPSTLNPATGACRNPTGCQVRGNICGGPSGQCGVNARAACCDCPGDPKKCCKADSVGIYRCFGGGSAQCPTGYTGQEPCCVAQGDRCSFSAECCGGVPCVPDGQGVLRCLQPGDGGVACVPSGDRCTSTGDCCVGLTCNIVPGSATGLCGPPPQPPAPDGGTDAATDGPAAPDGGATSDGGISDGASTPDADQPPPPPPPPTCALYGQSCSDSVPCCNDVPCSAPGGTGQRCQPGQTGCTCYLIIE